MAYGPSDNADDSLSYSLGRHY